MAFSRTLREVEVDRLVVGVGPRGLLAVADRLLVLEAGRPKMIGPAKDVVARLTAPPSSENAA
jgi:ABC-type protease/lipase transport system fused ATPase/permease subunit